MILQGDILFVRDKSLLGALVRFVSQSEYNHVAVFMNERTLISARLSGVGYESFKKVLEGASKDRLMYRVARIVEATPEDCKKMVEYMMTKVGRGYDWLQVLTLGVFLLFKAGLRFSPIDVKNKWLCSELIAEAAKEAGYLFEEGMDVNNVTPQIILESKIVRDIGV